MTPRSRFGEDRSPCFAGSSSSTVRRNDSSDFETSDASLTPPLAMAAIGLSSRRFDTAADALTSSSPSFWMSRTLVAKASSWTSRLVIASRKRATIWSRVAVCAGSSSTAPAACSGATWATGPGGVRVSVAVAVPAAGAAVSSDAAGAVGAGTARAAAVSMSRDESLMEHLLRARATLRRPRTAARGG